MVKTMIGNYTRKLDSKFRIAIPIVFKRQIGEIFYLSLGIDGVVEIRNINEFEMWIERIENSFRKSPKIRQLQRLILGNTIKVELDKLGRMKVPVFIYNILNSKELVFVGVGSRIEIFGKETYEKLQETHLNEETLLELSEKIIGEGNEI